MNKMFSDFLEPISSTQPEGIDVEYDVRFIDIQNLVEGKPEQQYGDVVIEAEEPDWVAIEKLCVQLLSESKDIRVFCYYAQALTALYGLNGFVIGCEALFTNLQKYWFELYPKLLDEDGEEDPFYRVGSIQLLLSSNGIVKQLLETQLLKSNNKRELLPFKVVLSILNSNDENLYPGGKEKLIQDIIVSYNSNQEELLLIEKALNILRGIEDIFNEKLSDEILDFSIINKPFEIINNLLKDAEKYNIEDNSDNQDISNDANRDMDNKNLESDILKTENYSLEHIKITNRDDVKVVLEKLILYFRVKEPSHPAPLFIERLNRLLNMDFYDILKDISPNSLNDLDLIIGKKEDAEEENN